MKKLGMIHYANQNVNYSESEHNNISDLVFLYKITKASFIQQQSKN